MQDEDYVEGIFRVYNHESGLAKYAVINMFPVGMNLFVIE